MLADAAAGHAVNAIFPNDETLARQKRGLKAIFTRFLTAANRYKTREQAELNMNERADEIVAFSTETGEFVDIEETEY